MSNSTTTPQRHTPPFLFGVLELPFGAAVGFLQVAVPYWLSKQGVGLAEIATLSGTAFLPHALKIFWVPLLDIGSFRKHWYIGSTLLTAVFLGLCSLVPDPVHHLAIYTLLLTAAQATAATSSSALNALMAITSREEDKSRVGGYQMAGNVGGTAILGTLPIWLAEHFTARETGLIQASIVLVCGAGALIIVEPKLAGDALAKAGSLIAAIAARFVEIVKDLWATTKSREGWTGILICAAPVGCGSLTNLFSAMAGDYHAPETLVMQVNGLAGGVVSAAGSIVGGYVADRMNRRVAYCAAGGLTALCAFAMAFGPMTPATYAWGSLTYNFANGIAFAAFAGMVLEMVSHGVAVTTKYALFVAISNQAISYVTWLDGHASRVRLPSGREWGTLGTITFDGMITVLGIVALAAMFALLRKPAEPAVAPAAAP